MCQRHPFGFDPGMAVMQFTHHVCYSYYLKRERCEVVSHLRSGVICSASPPRLLGLWWLLVAGDGKAVSSSGVCGRVSSTYSASLATSVRQCRCSWARSTRKNLSAVQATTFQSCIQSSIQQKLCFVCRLLELVKFLHIFMSHTPEKLKQTLSLFMFLCMSLSNSCGRVFVRLSTIYMVLLPAQ